jgi:hypothetical protein
MSDYTPTTQEVETHWVNVGFAGDRASFRRWLAIVQAAVLDLAASDWAADPDSWGDNEKDYRNELRDRAAEYRALAGRGNPEPKGQELWEYGAGLNGPRGYRRTIGVPAIPAGPWIPVTPEPTTTKAGA